MTDTEKAALERRIDELCAENEQLRVANAAFTGRSIRAGDKMACLEAENAKFIVKLNAEHIVRQNVEVENSKLRELLSSYWKAVHSPVTTNVPRDYLKEMRELGIEVE